MKEYPRPEDFNDGRDHWADCDDPLNCRCDEFVVCPACNGYCTINVIFGHEQDCPYCEEGMVHKDDFDSVYESTTPGRVKNE